MKLYPINLNVKDKLCVVIGAGDVAYRKAKSLLDAGARVKVISPDISQSTKELDGVVELVNREYEDGDLEGAFITIAATDDTDVNTKIAGEAKGKGVLLNVVDKPELCHFYVPSIVKRGNLVLSISTSGKFPALSKKLRKDLEKSFGAEYEKYLELLADARDKVINKYADLDKRKQILNTIVKLPIVELIEKGDIDKAKQEIERIVAG